MLEMVLKTALTKRAVRIEKHLEEHKILCTLHNLYKNNFEENTEEIKAII